MAIAFALGWQVASLYPDPPRQQPDRRPTPADLPGLRSLSDSQRTELGVRQIRAGLHRLSLPLAAAGLLPPDTASLQDAFENKPDPATGQAADLRSSLLALHVEALKTLTAADFRLGKAYGLGRALAETCEIGDLESLKRRFDHWRLRQLDTWLADLDSALPAHASSCVRMSLIKWGTWAQRVELDGKPLDWARDDRAVGAALHRQGQRWRALLSGEKAGMDMLKAKDYLRAVEEALGRAGKLAGGVLKNLWFLVVPVVLLLIAGVVVLATSDTAAGNIAAVVAFAAALGITWKGILGAAGRLGERIGAPLWGASLNVAIAEAITQLPRREATPPAEPAASPAAQPATSPENPSDAEPESP